MSKTTAKATIHRPLIRHQITTPSIILYGSIPSSSVKDWQTPLSASLSDLPIAILNPYRHDWDQSWVEDISFPKFREQVEWEMDYAQVADVIVFYFDPNAPSPVTLLELGMYAGTGKAVVCCPEGFYKRGNVQIVCRRYGIPLCAGLEELESVIRERLGEKLAAGAAA
ncbi:hypothetical protein BDW02DRAFT_567707 [Decorospora gaudefroyi]|uniref:Nucleoside 2-deoxyribosyltransferase n=1 Tax=Decorospora gaudefroyi TaxID=184978 RepID=A0A6A5KQ90_9PLEO|nr:hypothetical protein BDW02DRAFT_567707 [Decorospora gaudefroyi]